MAHIPEPKMLVIPYGHTVEFNDEPYCTVQEYHVFKQILDSGRLTIFRMTVCAECKKAIPKQKDYCSFACYMLSFMRANGGKRMKLEYRK